MSVALPALVAALLGFGSCTLPGDVGPGDGGPGAAGKPCELILPEYADVDGDRRADEVAHRLVEGRPVVQVCLAAGGYHEAAGQGQANAVMFTDVDGDGDEEILAGDDGGGAQRWAVLRWNGRTVVRTGVVLRNGFDGKPLPSWVWGCEKGHFVLVHVDWERRVTTFATYDLEGGDDPVFRTERMPPGAKHPTYQQSVTKPCSLHGRTPPRR